MAFIGALASKEPRCPPFLQALIRLQGEQSRSHRRPAALYIGAWPSPRRSASFDALGGRKGGRLSTPWGLAIAFKCGVLESFLLLKSDRGGASVTERFASSAARRTLSVDSPRQNQKCVIHIPINGIRPRLAIGPATRGCGCLTSLRHTTEAGDQGREDFSCLNCSQPIEKSRFGKINPSKLESVY